MKTKFKSKVVLEQSRRRAVIQNRPDLIKAYVRLCNHCISRPCCLRLPLDIEGLDCIYHEDMTR